MQYVWRGISNNYESFCHNGISTGFAWLNCGLRKEPPLISSDMSLGPVYFLVLVGIISSSEEFVAFLDGLKSPDNAVRDAVWFESLF